MTANETDQRTDEVVGAFLAGSSLKNAVKFLLREEVPLHPDYLDEAAETIVHNNPHNPQLLGVAMGYTLLADLYRERLVPVPPGMPHIVETPPTPVGKRER
jgi:hypothetical protein